MVGKWVGALCIFVACSGIGFSVAYKQMKELRLLSQFVRILDRMKKEIQYFLRPIPDLCRIISSEEEGELGQAFLRLAIEMENQIQPDVSRCMSSIISSMNHIAGSILDSMESLGRELGRYDLDGQLLGIAQIREVLMERYNTLNHDKKKRMRGYQTLGVCAGAALVILFI